MGAITVGMRKANAIEPMGRSYKFSDIIGP